MVDVAQGIGPSVRRVDSACRHFVITLEAISLLPRHAVFRNEILLDRVLRSCVFNVGPNVK